MAARQARARRRRRLQQRQTAIFGGLVALLLLMILVAAAVFTGLLPSPYARDFSREDEDPESVTPCVPAGTTAEELGSITTNVFNATDRTGLAATTGENLSRQGVLVNTEANWPQGQMEGAVQIMTGARGITAAYTLQRLFPAAEVTFEPGREDATVDVVLGTGFDSMLSDAEISELDPEEPLSSPAECTPVDIPQGDPEGADGEGEPDEGETQEQPADTEGSDS